MYLYNYQLIDSAVFILKFHIFSVFQSIFKGSMLNVSSICNIMTNQVNTCGSHRVDGGIMEKLQLNYVFFCFSRFYYLSISSFHVTI